MSPMIDLFEAVAEDETEQVLSRKSAIAAFHAGSWTNRRFYMTYQREFVMRIRLGNLADSYLVHRLGASHGWLAKEMSGAIAEESRHDLFLLRDLYALGMTPSELAMDPLPGSRNLVAHLYDCIDAHGPVSAVVWAWYQQWYSDRFDSLILAKAAQEFGQPYVAGAQEHMQVHIDLLEGVAGREAYRETLFGWIAHLNDQGVEPAELVAALKGVIRKTAGFYEDIHAAASRLSAVVGGRS